MQSFNQIIINENFFGDAKQKISNTWNNVKQTTNNAIETAQTIAAPATTFAGLGISSLGNIIGIPGSQNLGATLMATGTALSLPGRAKSISTMAKTDFQKRQQETAQRNQQSNITPQIQNNPQQQKPIGLNNNTQQK